MKTTTNRIHRNGASKRTASQVQKRSARKAEPASTGQHRREGLDADLPLDGATLLFYSQPDDATLASAEVSPAQLRALKQAAKQSGMTIEQLLNRGISDALAKMELLVNGQSRETEGFVYSFMDEFAAAKAQSGALHTLLFDAMADKESEYGDEVQFGITELMLQTHDRMNRVFAACERQVNVSAIAGRTEVAS